MVKLSCFLFLCLFLNMHIFATPPPFFFGAYELVVVWCQNCFQERQQTWTLPSELTLQEQPPAHPLGAPVLAGSSELANTRISLEISF